MGAKGKNLDILKRNGISVPRGFTLDPKYYHQAVSPFFNNIASSLPDQASIFDIIMAIELPDEIQSAINRGLCDMDGVKKFAVRSSGTVVVGADVKLSEDHDELSLAGQFDSFLNVPKNLVPHAVKQCWASLFNQRSIDGFSANSRYVTKSYMTVVIQEMITAKSSAVMMTVDPLGSGSTGAIEFTWGPCEAIVSGSTSPDDAIFERSSGKIVECNVGQKLTKTSYTDYPGPDGNSRKMGLSSQDQARLSLTSAELAEAIKIGIEIENIFGKPQDIEMVVNTNGNIVVTQARPMTSLPAKISPIYQLNDQLMKGTRS